MVRVNLEFSGGLELLFDNRKEFKDVEVPPQKEGQEEGIVTMKHLINWVKDNLLAERPELFVMNGSIRPGILCLINDSDWEIAGTLDYEVEDQDNISFISTLHGG
eukprot:gb/GECG01016200.1/.p1 GENE.gb/GECG01016200.1/~~gb/GECG01016200.1/.p1  ORF type:complete len:105 (+),score=13.37 gb/GECG01016200.1/:1-315(+)